MNLEELLLILIIGNRRSVHTPDDQSKLKSYLDNAANILLDNAHHFEFRS